MARIVVAIPDRPIPVNDDLAPSTLESGAAPEPRPPAPPPEDMPTKIEREPMPRGG